MRALVCRGLVAVAAAPAIVVAGAAAASANQVLTADSLCYMVASQVNNVTQSATGGTAVAGQVLAVNASTPVAVLSSTPPDVRTADPAKGLGGWCSSRVADPVGVNSLGD